MEGAIFCSHISDSLYLAATEAAKGDLPDDYTVQLRLKREDEGYSNRNIRLRR